MKKAYLRMKLIQGNREIPDISSTSGLSAGQAHNHFSETLRSMCFRIPSSSAEKSTTGHIMKCIIYNSAWIKNIKLINISEKNIYIHTHIIL